MAQIEGTHPPRPLTVPQGLDCLAWLVPLTTGPMSVLSYSVPLLSASYVVVGRRPAPPPTEIRDHVKMAFIPFTGYTWLLVAGILLTSATAMMAFEWGKKEATGRALAGATHCLPCPTRGLYRMNARAASP